MARHVASMCLPRATFSQVLLLVLPDQKCCLTSRSWNYLTACPLRSSPMSHGCMRQKPQTTCYRLGLNAGATCRTTAIPMKPQRSVTRGTLLVIAILSLSARTSDRAPRRWSNRLACSSARRKTRVEKFRASFWALRRAGMSRVHLKPTAFCCRTAPADFGLHTCPVRLTCAPLIDVYVWSRDGPINVDKPRKVFLSPADLSEMDEDDSRRKLCL